MIHVTLEVKGFSNLEMDYLGDVYRLMDLDTIALERYSG